MATDRRRPILMPELQAKIERFSNKTWHSYGIHQVVVRLRNGTEHRGVFVAWCKEVVRVKGHERIPFKLEDIVDVRLR